MPIHFVFRAAVLLHLVPLSSYGEENFKVEHGHKKILTFNTISGMEIASDLVSAF